MEKRSKYAAAKSTIRKIAELRERYVRLAIPEDSLVHRPPHSGYAPTFNPPTYSPPRPCVRPPLRISVVVILPFFRSRTRLANLQLGLEARTQLAHYRPSLRTDFSFTFVSFLFLRAYAKLLRRVAFRSSLRTVGCAVAPIGGRGVRNVRFIIRRVYMYVRIHTWYTYTDRESRRNTRRQRRTNAARTIPSVSPQPRL